MSLPAVGPGVVLKIEDLVPVGATVTKLVGRLCGNYREVFDDTAVGVQQKRAGKPAVVETQTVAVAAVSGVATLTTNPLRWNASTTTANAIGGVYEYTATVEVTGETWTNDYVFTFMLDEQAALTLDGDGNVSYDQVAADDDGVPLPGARISLESLSDVDATTTAPGDTQALIWNAATSKWEPGDVVNETALIAEQAAQDVLIAQAQAAALEAQNTADAAATSADLAAEIASTDAEQIAQDALIAENAADIVTNAADISDKGSAIAFLTGALAAEIASTNAEQDAQDVLIAANTTLLGPFNTAWTEGEITGTSIDHRNSAAVIDPSVLHADSFFRYKKFGKIVFIEIYLKVTAGGFGTNQFRVYGMDTIIGTRLTNTISTLHGYATLGSRIWPVQAFWASNAALTFYAPRSTSRPDMTNMADDNPEAWSADDFVRVSGFVSVA